MAPIFELCLTFEAGPAGADAVERSVRSFFDRPVAEVIAGTDATVDQTPEDFARRGVELDDFRVERDGDTVYAMAARKHAFMQYEAVVLLVLAAEPCEGRVLVAHVSDAEFWYFQLYEWDGEGYATLDTVDCVDSDRPLDERAVLERLHDEHGIRGRTYTTTLDT